MIYNPYFDGRRKPPDIPDDAEYNERCTLIDIVKGMKPGKE